VGGSCPEIAADAAEDDQRPHNTFVLAGPEGRCTGTGRSTRSRTAGRTSTSAAASRSRRSRSTGCGSRGSSATTCGSRTSSGSSLRRPTSTLVPANWPGHGRAHWTALLQARAIENQAYVVGCNRVGSGGGLSYSGDSRIVDPLGELLATAAKSESILLADVSAEEVAAVRDRFRFLQDRR
jgi:hypothetical protein